MRKASWRCRGGASNLGYGELLPYRGLTNKTPADAANPIYDGFDRALANNPGASPTSPSATTSASGPSSAAAAESSSNGVDNSDLIGGVLAAVLLIGVAVVVLRRRRSGNGPPPPPSYSFGGPAQR